MKIALAFPSLLRAFLLLFLSCLFLLIFFAPDLPNALALGSSLQQLFVVLWLALFTIVLHVLEILVIDAHANTYVVLPCVAVVASNPWIVGIVTVLACGTANTTYNFFLVFRFRFGLLLGGGFLSTALWLNGLLECVGVSFVLAFGATHRPSRFCIYIPKWSVSSMHVELCRLEVVY